TVPVRLNAANAFGQGWVSGHQGIEASVNTLAKEHVAEFGSMGIAEQGALAVGADLLQSAGSPIWISRELNGGGVCKKFPLSAHRRLDYVAEKGSGVTNNHQAQSQNHHDQPCIAIAASS